jgi:hypothetical protein
MHATQKIRYSTFIFWHGERMRCYEAANAGM